MAGRAFSRKTRAAALPREAQTMQDQPDLQERIRRRAHEIYLQDGRLNQSDVEDWLQAEREILAEQRDGSVDGDD